MKGDLLGLLNKLKGGGKGRIGYYLKDSNYYPKSLQKEEVRIPNFTRWRFLTPSY